MGHKTYNKLHLSQRFIKKQQKKNLIIVKIHITKKEKSRKKLFFSYWQFHGKLILGKIVEISTRTKLGGIHDLGYFDCLGSCSKLLKTVKGSKSKSLPFFKPTSVCDSQNLTQYSNWNNQNASKGIEDTFTVLKYLEELSLNLILNCLQ